MNEYDVHDPDSEAPSWHRHEWTGEEALFAAQVLQHGDVGRAYGAAFHPGERKHKATCIVAGQRLMQEPFMREYITFIRAQIKERLSIDKDRVLEELSFLAYSNMADFMVIQENGSAVTDLSGLTREQLAALQEVTIETYQEGRGDDAIPVKSVKFKLAPKTAAIELLGKYNKLWTDVMETSDLSDIGDLMSKRRQQRRNRQEAQGEDSHGNDTGTDSEDA